jgi:glycosyltransferase involved in cell wall biosynthesis
MKLSIITINLNNAEGLQRTIESVVSQTFTDYEYIIIDGGSTDGSVDIIKQYAEKVTYWVSEPDKGIYNAMNKGIAIAKGEYCNFMNSGDRFMHDYTLQNVFSGEHSADLLAGNIFMYGKRLGVRNKMTFYHLIHSTIWHQATFTKRSLFYEIGFYDEELRISSDWKFALLALVKYDRSIEILDEDIALMEPNGISCSGEASIQITKEEEKTIKTYFPYFYDDYKELHRLKRFTFKRLKRHIIWRVRNILYRTLHPSRSNLLKNGSTSDPHEINENS